jgi:hypothetical protein
MEKPITITCPQCGKIITDDPLIALAVTGKGQASQFIKCECGNQISFWAVTAQLREQKKFGRRVGNWFRSLFKGRD